FYGTTTYLVHQGASQLPVELLTSLDTNCVLRFVGRSSERDAVAASEWLPRTGRVRRARVPGSPKMAGGPFLADSQEARYWIGELGRLRGQHFLVSDRRAPFSPRIVRAA